MRLRDHDRPCEHGYKVEHIATEDNGTQWSCNGGAEVTIDYEAATNVAIGRSGDPWDNLHPDYVRVLRNRMEEVRLVVDAALGIVEEDKLGDVLYRPEDDVPGADPAISVDGPWRHGIVEKDA